MQRFFTISMNLKQDWIEQRTLLEKVFISWYIYPDGHQHGVSIAFRRNIVKVVVDPRGDSRVDPQTTWTMLKIDVHLFFTA